MDERYDDLDIIVRKLQCMNLKEISRQVPLHYQSIYKIAKGITKEPNYSTVKILKEFLQKL